MKSTRWQDKFLNHFTFLLFAFTLLNAVLSFAGPSRTTYQAKIVKPDGYPLEATSVNFKFTILDPSGSCAIFAETYNGVNMTSTGGLISFSLGSGVKTFPVSGTTFEQIFSNITPNIACDTGGGPPAVYTPLANDARKILMQFHDGLGWQTLPAMTINAVPYAMYANDSQKFNGMIPSEFVQVSTIPTCTASEALRYTGSAFQCVAAGGTGSVSSGSVITALGFTPADSTNLSTVSTYASNVSSTVFSVSSTVSSFQNTVAASFAAIVNSQWVTSGTAISYSAGRVGVGGLNTAYNFYLAQPVSGSTQMGIDAYAGTPGIYFRRANGTADTPLAVSATQALMELAAVGYGQTGFINSSAAKILISAEEDWTNSTAAASIRFHTRASSTTAASIERMRIDKNGFVGIGTTLPVTKLDVSGGLRISMETASCAVSYAGTLRYNSGIVEYCNGTSWSAFGVAGAGILAINGLVSGSQTFAIGNSGTVPNISSVGSVHNFNFPYAASAGVTAGLLSNSDYAVFNNKQSATSAAMIATLGYTPADTVSVTTLSSTVASLASSTATSFSAITSSQWVTSGTSIYFNTGNVGIGVSSPSRKLHVGLGDNQDVIFGLYDGIAGNFRFLNKYTDGYNYIQAGVDSTDTAAKIRFSRMGTSNNLADVRFSSDLTSFNGLVGVGITSATNRLHVYNNSTLGAGWGAFDTTSAVLRIQEASGSGLYMDGNSIVNDMSGRLSFGTLQNQPISFGTSNTERMIISGDGEVGIGVGSPAANLHVAGNNNQTLFRLNTASAAIYVGEDVDLPTIMRIRPTVGSGVAITGNNDTPGVYVYSNSYVAIGGNFIPTAGLHIRQGTTSSAPLKFTSGTLVTTPQTGSMEFDGNSFYLTDNSGIRRAIATGTSSGALDNASIINSTGNITLVPQAGSVIVSATTASVNSATGALVVKGGVGIVGDTNISGTVTAANAIMALSTGVVGIGASNPVTKLDVRSEGALKVARIQYSGTGFSSQPNLELHRSRGTIDAPSAVAANDTLGSISALGHNGTSFGVGSTAAIVFKAHQAFNTTSHGSYMTFNTTASGTTNQLERVRLDHAGFLGLGTTTPLERLDVNGAIRFGSSNAPFMVLRETTSAGAATTDGSRWSYEDDAFGVNQDGVVFEKTDTNANVVDGGFLFANRGMDNIRVPALAIRGAGVAVGLNSAGFARLAITSGSSTIAPLKFTSGNLNTTPQAGAMEYDGSNYYLTDNTGIRRNILWGSSSSPVVTNSTMQAVEFIATSATITPYVYGSQASGGNLRLEASTASTKGAITLGMSGTTFVGIGVSAPLSPLHVVGGINPTMGTEDDDDGIVIQNFQPTLTFRDMTVNDPDDVRLRMDATNLYFESSTDFLTNSPVTTTHMTLTGSGNLGIDTTAPVARLDINYPGSTPNALNSNVNNYINKSGMRVAADFGAGSNALYFGASELSNSRTSWIQSGHRDPAFASQVSDSELLLQPHGGHVGIGTQTPTAALHILTSGTTSRGLRIVANASVAGAYAEAQFVSDIREYRIGVGSASETAHNVPGKYYLYDGASNTMRMVVDAAGNVGVGTAAPIARFDVARPTTQGSQLALRNNGDSGFITVPASTDGVILSTAKYDGANWITSSTMASAFTVGEGFIQMFTNSGLTPGASFSYTERARIDTAGNFMIGTTNSAHGRLAVESSGTAYLSLNTTNGGHKRSGVLFRSAGSVQMEIGVDAGVNGTRDFYLFDSVSGTSRFHVNSNGNIGIGTASPQRKLHVIGDATINAISGGESNGSGNFHLDAWGTGADRSVYLNWAGGIGGAKVGNGSSTWGPIAASAFNVSSDQRLKENIKPIQNPLEKILKIDAVTFTWKEESRRKMEGERIGLIAQNVEKVFPQAVKLDHSENALPGGTRLVNYPDLVSPIIAAIKEFYSLWVNDSKELHREIASVKEENEKLKSQNADKEKQLKDIRDYLCAKDPKAPICK